MIKICRTINVAKKHESSIGQALRAIGLNGVCAILLGLGTVALGSSTAAQAQDLPFADPYVFADRFPDLAEVKALGFPVSPEPFLTLGMVISKEEAEKAGTPLDIESATASNGKVSVDLNFADIGILQLWDNWETIELFDEQAHVGEWTFTTIDSSGAAATATPVRLDQMIELPFVEELTAQSAENGDLTVTWSMPELSSSIEDACAIDFRLRLLSNLSKQFYRSATTTDTTVTVPAETLAEKGPETLDGAWARVETTCRDQEATNLDGTGKAMARSNTFFAL